MYNNSSACQKLDIITEKTPRFGNTFGYLKIHYKKTNKQKTTKTQNPHKNQILSVLNVDSTEPITKQQQNITSKY